MRAAPDGARQPRRITVGSPTRQGGHLGTQRAHDRPFLPADRLLRGAGGRDRGGRDVVTRARTSRAQPRSRAATTPRGERLPRQARRRQAGAPEHGTDPAGARGSVVRRQAVGTVRQHLEQLQGTLGGKLRLQRPSTTATAHRHRRLREREEDFECPSSAPRAGDRGHARRGARDRGPASATRPIPAPRSHARPTRPRLYKLSPRSTCFGGSMELHGGHALRGQAPRQDARRGRLRQETGAVGGDVACTSGGTPGSRARRSTATSTTSPDPAGRRHAGQAGPGAKPTATAKPALTTPSGLPPTGERFTATSSESRSASSSPPSSSRWRS